MPQLHCFDCYDTKDDVFFYNCFKDLPDIFSNCFDYYDPYHDDISNQYRETCTDKFCDFNLYVPLVTSTTFLQEGIILTLLVSIYLLLYEKLLILIIITEILFGEMLLILNVIISFMGVILTQLLIQTIPSSFRFLTSSAVGATEFGDVIQLIQLFPVSSVL